MFIYYNHIEHSRVKINFFHQLNVVQAIRSLPIESFEILLTHDQCKKMLLKLLQRGIYII